MSAAGNVLIGGGTGFIGNHLCNLLKGKGYGVTVVSRMPGPQRISWSVLLKDGLPKGTTAVVNLAGQNVMDFKRRWSPGFKQNIFNSRINTTITLAKMIEQATVKPQAFVTMSGVGAYRPDPHKTYTEESHIEDFDFFSKLCRHWEKAACLKPDGTGVRVVTIRSGVVLGRDGGMIKQLYMPFYLGVGGPIGDGSQYMPWIHIDDLTNLIIFAIENSKTEGIYNGVAPEPCTNKEFSRAFGKALRRPAFIPLPSFVMNILLNKERAIMVTKGQKVLPARTESAGFKFKYSGIESACKEVVNG